MSNVLSKILPKDSLKSREKGLIYTGFLDGSKDISFVMLIAKADLKVFSFSKEVNHKVNLCCNKMIKVNSQV